MIENRAAKGFTLIEVMLAMAIFAIAGVAMLGVAQNNFISLSLIEQKTVAHWVAANQMVEVTMDNAWPPKDKKKGKVEMAEKTWYWQQKVVKTQDSSMRQVTIEVRDDEKAEKPITELISFVAKPANTKRTIR